MISPRLGSRKRYVNLSTSRRSPSWSVGSIELPCTMKDWATKKMMTNAKTTARANDSANSRSSDVTLPTTGRLPSALFLDAGRLSHSVAQVVQPRLAHFALPGHLDLVDLRRV